MNRGAIVSQGWKLTLEDKRLWGIAVLILFSEAAIRLVLPGDINFFWTIISSSISLLFAAFLNGILICMIAAHLENRSLTVKEGFGEGWHWLLPLFMLRLLLQIPTWGIALVTQGALPENTQTMLESSQAGAVMLFMVFDLLVILLCSTVMVGADRAVILERRSIISALQRGWRLLWEHLGDYWGISARVFVIIFGIGIALGCLWVALGFIILSDTLPSLPPSISNLGLAIVSGFLVPFGAATWTLAFREWQAQERSDLPAAPDVPSPAIE